MSTAKQYLVIVHRPRPSRAQLAQQSWSPEIYPVIQRVRATDAQAAADHVGVAPGGYAEVVEVEHVRRFDRAEKAPLVERERMVLNQGEIRAATETGGL